MARDTISRSADQEVGSADQEVGSADQEVGRYTP